MHAITYYIEIGDNEQNEDGEPLEIYNLMYFSKDYQQYQFILLRYDFSMSSYREYINVPEKASNILSFIPLTDIGNIYENIAYSFAQELLINGNMVSTNFQFYDKFIDFANCAKVFSVLSVPCKSCGLNFREVIDGKWCTLYRP